MLRISCTNVHVDGKIEDARLSYLGTSTCRQGVKIMRSSRRGVIVSGFYLFFIAVAVLAIGLVLKPTPAIYADECGGCSGSSDTGGGSNGNSDTGGGDHGEIGPAGNGSAEVFDVSINGSSIGSSDMIGVTDRRIIIMVVFTGLATDYRISENPDFAGAEWQEIPGFGRPAIEIKYTLSEGSGIKTIYFQAKRNATIAGVIKIQVKLS